MSTAPFTFRVPADELDAFEGPGDDGAAAKGWFRPRLRASKGFASSEFKAYLKDRDTTKKDEQLLLELRFEADWDLAPRLSAYLRPRFLIDALDDELVRFEPLDLYVSYDAEQWDLRAGQFVENWGIADTFNPVDVLNRRDLGTDILDQERLGELGVRARYHFNGNDTVGEPSVALYVMPLWRETVFPTDSNRFSFSQLPFELQEEDDDRPPDDERLFLAARAQHTLSTGPANADVQYVVARGPERFPFFSAVPRPGGTVDLFPQYYGTWTAGGGVRAVPNADGWSEFTFKTEVVYKAPYRFRRDSPDRLPDQYLQYVVGLDRLVPNVFSRSRTS